MEDNKKAPDRAESEAAEGKGDQVVLTGKAVIVRDPKTREAKLVLRVK